MRGPILLWLTTVTAIWSENVGKTFPVQWVQRRPLRCSCGSIASLGGLSRWLNFLLHASLDFLGLTSIAKYKLLFTIVFLVVFIGHLRSGLFFNVFEFLYGESMSHYRIRRKFCCSCSHHLQRLRIGKFWIGLSFLTIAPFTVWRVWRKLSTMLYRRW